MPDLLAFLLRLLASPFRSTIDLEVEVLALRQQLAIYQRSALRPRLRLRDRLLWCWLPALQALVRLDVDARSIARVADRGGRGTTDEEGPGIPSALVTRRLASGRAKRDSIPALLGERLQCWLGLDEMSALTWNEMSVLSADLSHSHAGMPRRGDVRSEDLDEYILCLDQDQTVSVLLDDGAHKMRLELRNPVLHNPVSDSEVPINIPGEGPLPWGYNVDNDLAVPASDVLITAAEHGNAAGAPGPILHFVSPNAQCYVLTVRASFGDDRVPEWEDGRRLDLDDELFWTSAPYSLYVRKGCPPGDSECTTIQPVPSLW